MEKLSSAAALIDKCRPERPVRGLRPHAAGRAARWFLEKFPGDVAYAYKANSSVFLIGALYGAGIRHFDVASLPEIEDAATIPDAHLHFMHPVKSPHAIRRAYEMGVRSFALDGEDELDKILDATGNARDLLLWVRIAVPAINSRIPLERKFGLSGQKAARLLMKTRQVAAELGLTFHVGSQTTTPDAFVTALGEVHKLIVKAGVVIDRLDVGGGFPARYPDSDPAPLQDFLDTILDGIEMLPVRENIKLMCEPGRALVAEAESLIVRVDARRDGNLFINDGSYGMLFDAAHLGFIFPTPHRQPRRRSLRAAAALRAVGADVRLHRLHEGPVHAAGVDGAGRLHRDRQHGRLRAGDRGPFQRLRRVRRGDPPRRADADHVRGRGRRGAVGAALSLTRR